MTRPAPEEGAKHLLTALTCFLSRKQMQVHTREAIKRKALIPICNCFSISTGLLTGPKSGDTLSLQSLSPGLRAHRVSSFFPSPPLADASRHFTPRVARSRVHLGRIAADDDDPPRRSARPERASSRRGLLPRAYRKQNARHPRDSRRKRS